MIWILSCADPPAEVESCASGDDHVAVMDRITIGRAELGISPGFNLDGVVTRDGDRTGCGVGDYVTPEGVDGVDNGFAILVPALELTEAAAVEGLLQDAINTGELLLMFEVTGVDDPAADGCVGFTFERGAGTPMMGTDGSLEWHQTFDRDPEVPAITVEGLTMVEGRVEAQGMDVLLPLQVLNADLLLHMYDVSIHATLAEDGSFHGVFAGGVSTDEIMTVATYENVDADLAGAVQALLDIAADLDPDGDGTCEQLAMTFEFTAIPAFFFEE